MKHPANETGHQADATPRHRGDRGGWWVVAQSVLMVAVGWVGWRWPGDWPGSGWNWLAGGLGALGAYLGIAGAWHLGKGRTIFPEPLPDAVLVETGIYRHIRHPLYASVMVLACAWACWRNSHWSMGLAAVLMAFLGFKAVHEENRLCRRFPQYRAYQRRTARLLPGLW